MVHTCLMKPVTLTLLGILFICPVTGAAGQEASNCVRGEPEPLFSTRSKGIATQSFKLKSAVDAEETLRLNTGAEVRIRNWGCEYFVITIHYQSERIRGNETGMRYWLSKSAEVLRLMARSDPNVVFDLKKAAATLEAKARSGETLNFDHPPFLVEGDGTDFLQTQVVVKSGGRMKGKSGGYVEVQLMKGPL